MKRQVQPLFDVILDFALPVTSSRVQVTSHLCKRLTHDTPREHMMYSGCESLMMTRHTTPPTLLRSEAVCLES